MVHNKQKWSNCLLRDLFKLKMEYSNKKWFVQFRKCVATPDELIQ